MAVPVPLVLASSPFTGLLILLFAVLGFAVVAGVVVVILALLHAVLPGGDSGADALHAEELRRQQGDPDPAHHDQG
jgi:hypothetical protein